ncbi:hypothetical protein F4819DRAFT_446313 [Hypoxylon fuscum]|nr:hypothetical protein F4819DRAFT_446313 [Hypoxylon fuscum]
MEKLKDPNINQHIMTFVLDRFISQRKNPALGFKDQLGDMLSAWGGLCYRMLDQKHLASLFMSVRGRWGSDVAKQALRAVGTTALKSNGVYAPVEPENAEMLTTLNRMIHLMRERAASIETFDQLVIIFDSAMTLRMLRDDVTSALAQLQEGFDKWDVDKRYSLERSKLILEGV